MADRGYRSWVNSRCQNVKCAGYKRRHRTRKKPHLYIQEWRGQCPLCRRTLTVDLFRESGREVVKYNCECGGRPWRHRRGSPGCVHSKMFAAGFRYDDIGTPEYQLWRETGVPF
jgi:hypothetical protein